MLSPAVMVRDLAVELGAHPVLQGVNLVAEPGEVVALMGANGAGKSTLLRCVAGLQHYMAGEVRVFGATPAADAPFWRAVGLVAEPPAWYPGLSVREHLEVIRLTHRPIPQTFPGVDEIMEAFDLGTRSDASPLTLSSGQRQRLALAAVFVRPSRLLLLDEPEQGLDAESRQSLAEMVVHYAASGGTVLMASHDVELVRDSQAERVLLSDGRTPSTQGPVAVP